jgi:hypothetical protein
MKERKEVTKGFLNSEQDNRGLVVPNHRNVNTGADPPKVEAKAKKVADGSALGRNTMIRTPCKRCHRILI